MKSKEEVEKALAVIRFILENGIKLRPRRGTTITEPDIFDRQIMWLFMELESCLFWILDRKEGQDFEDKIVNLEADLFSQLNIIIR